MSRLIRLLAAAAVMLLAQEAHAGGIIPLEEQLHLLEQGRTPALIFPGSRYRVGVFPFEDPDGLGIGNEIAALISTEILFNTPARSLAVMRFTGSLRPSADDEAGYFEIVDKISNAQQVTLAVWGRMSRTGDQVVIDTFILIPERTRDGAFTWKVKLGIEPQPRMLIARLRPSRVHVQSLQMSLADAKALAARAKSLSQLRKTASADAAVAVELTGSQLYWIDERQGDWILLNAPGAGRGWVRLDGDCINACGALKRAGRFSGDLVAFMDSGALPEVTADLTQEAEAIRDQLHIFRSLAERDAYSVEKGLGRLAPWLTSGTGMEVAKTPPGGAAFANMRALGRAVLYLKQAARDGKLTEQPGLPPGEALSIANELAAASMTDPYNSDVLENLGVLFRIAKDDKRAKLASDLAANVAAKN